MRHKSLPVVKGPMFSFDLVKGFQEVIIKLIKASILGSLYRYDNIDCHIEKAVYLNSRLRYELKRCTKLLKVIDSL